MLFTSQQNRAPTTRRPPPTPASIPTGDASSSTGAVVVVASVSELALVENPPSEPFEEVAGAEDVLLVARDNPDLLRRLTEFVDFHDHRGKPAARKKKKDDRDPADDMPGLR